MLNRFLITFISLVFVTHLYAEEQGIAKDLAINECASATTKNQQNAPIYFIQHLFDDGTRDLVLSQVIPAKTADIKRVTYDKNQNCKYQSLAIAEGAGWGWHLVWADAQNIYYVRMDGEAWVSSVPKKTLANNAINLHFAQEKSLLILCWQADGASFSMQSDDEGRSWQGPIINSSN